MINKITCSEASSSLGAWLDGELSPSKVEELRGHLETCSSCLREMERLERLQESLKRVLQWKAADVAFDPFWTGVRQRIEEKRLWRLEVIDWIWSRVSPQSLAWAIPVIIAVLIGAFYLNDLFTGWRAAQSRYSAAVESIDGHGFNVALLRDLETKTTLIWVFQDQDEEDESSGEADKQRHSTF